MLRHEKINIRYVSIVMLLIMLLMTIPSSTSCRHNLGLYSSIDHRYHSPSASDRDNILLTNGTLNSTSGSESASKQEKDFAATIQESDSAINYAGVIIQRTRHRIILSSFGGISCAFSAYLLVPRILNDSLADDPRISNLSSSTYVKTTHKIE